MKNDYKILLVDDDEDILWINQMILSEAGFLVDISNDPLRALKKVYSEPFHIFILDYMMPKMRGDELAEKIIRYNASVNRACGIIFLTGYSEFADYIGKVGGSNNQVLLKPISENELIEAVNLKINNLDNTRARANKQDRLI